MLIRAHLVALLGAAALVPALLPAAAFGAGPAFGVAEDATKYADDGGAALFQEMRELGMSENRVEIFWNANDPTTVQEQDFLDRMLPVAQQYGIQITLSVQPAPALAFAVDQRTRIALFAAFLERLATRYPEVRNYVIGNEPNERLFLQPQHGRNGQILSGATYEAVLAASYDALESVDPSIGVIGLALSPDGNNAPAGFDNESVSPALFIGAVGRAYRRSGRTAPLMDFVDLHIYAGKNTMPLTKLRRWPNAGGADLDTIKQAFWDAFHGTGQPVFAELGGARSGAAARVVRFRLDETATQVAIDPAKVDPALYGGKENVPTVDEATQARYYSDLIELEKCDPSVASLLFFHLIDEPALRGFQSGLLRRDFSERPSFTAVRDGIARSGTCAAPHAWRHATRVVGAKAVFDEAGKPARQRIFGLTATAGENAYARAGIFRVVGALPAASDLRRALAGSQLPAPGLAPALTPALAAERLIKAYRAPRLEFRGRLRPGIYVYAIWMCASMNPSRTALFVSAPFRVA